MSSWTLADASGPTPVEDHVEAKVRSLQRGNHPPHTYQSSGPVPPHTLVVAHPELAGSRFSGWVNELDVADTNRGWESDDDDCCSTGRALPVVRSGHRAT